MTYKFIVVGVGEGGGRLASAFQEFSYQVAAINTAKSDLDGLHIPDKNKFLLQISQGGTGKDPLIVKNALTDLNHRENLRAFVGSLIDSVDEKSSLYFLLCVGGGGGSGSGLANIVLDIFLEFGIPVGCIYTLPSNEEDTVTKKNAIETFQEIYNQKAVTGSVSPLIIVDNAFMNKLQIPIKDFYFVVNRKIAEAMHKFNSFSSLPSEFFSAVDPLDFGRVLSIGGVCSLGEFIIGEGGFANPADLASVKELMHQNLFVEGVNIDSAKSAAVIVTAPEFMLENEHISNCIKFIFEETARTVGGGLVFRGVYGDPGLKNMHIYLIYNGLTYPQDRFAAMFQDIKSGISAIKRKENRFSEMAFDTDAEVMPSQIFQKIKSRPIAPIKPTPMVVCDNCVLSSLTKVSTNRYNGKGPIPFSSGRCPRCGGRGMYEYKEKK